jgi:hypothetical protein
MKHFLNTVLLIFVLTIIMGCDKNEIVPDEDFKIEYGTECGWCAGQEFITISSLKIDYSRNIPCGDEKGTINKSREIKSSEWDEINSSFDYSLFKTLEYNECNVCVDGCDEIIKITENDNTHQLRYSLSDEVEGMQDLQQILTVVLKEMREMN